MALPGCKCLGMAGSLEAPSHKRLGGPRCLSSFAPFGDISSFVLFPSIRLWQFNYFTERGEMLLELEMTKEKLQSWRNLPFRISEALGNEQLLSTPCLLLTNIRN